MLQSLSGSGRCLVGVVGLAVCAAAVWADDTKGDTKASDGRLVGTWRNVSAVFGGQQIARPEGQTSLKHVTPTQFMWVTYDSEGQVVRTAGGSYTLKGMDYVETPEYGMGEDFQ